MFVGITNVNQTEAGALIDPEISCLNGFLNCLNCRQAFNFTNRSPLVIPCGDTICRECVQSAIEAADGFKCVDCRECVDTVCLKNLSVNIALLRNLDAMKLLANDDVSMHSKSKPPEFTEKELDEYISTKLMEIAQNIDDEVASLDNVINVIQGVYQSMEDYVAEVNDQTIDEDQDGTRLIVPALTGYYIEWSNPLNDSGTTVLE